MELPIIPTAGLFISEVKFHGISRSPLRTVEEYELEFYPEDGGFTHLNGEAYPMRRGNLLIARPGDQRRSTLPFRCRFIRLQPPGDDLRPLLDSLCGVTVMDDPDACEKRFANVAAWRLSDDPYNRFAAAAEVLTLLRQVHRQRERLLEQSGGSDVLTLAMRCIEQRYMQPLTVEDIARDCHVSASYLHRLFVAHLSSTPHAALTRRRVLAAKALLVNTREPISQIAWKCGFNSSSYFSDCFRKQTGQSPREFREGMGYQL